MTRRKVSNPLALAVLSLLLERPMHPYEMSRTLRERNKEGSIKLNYGSLYSVVDKLVAHGLIEPQKTVRDGRRPERTVYGATSAGRAEFEDWLAELLAIPVKEFSQFEAGLSLLPGLPPEEVVDLLDQRCVQLEHSLASSEAILKASAPSLPRLFWIEWDYVRTHLETDLHWTRKLVGEIRDGSFDGLADWRAFHTDDTPPDLADPARDVPADDTRGSDTRGVGGADKDTTADVPQRKASGRKGRLKSV
ncbi:PadR family transcriptional regulator [Actinopolymorpha sp. B11F2]|uniref:PadR family transcriptional regulator n=1 Tax=Actinopolymorpha sp. B11F2 TaxID=3160862 RepID=UPI0032E4840A